MGIYCQVHAYVRLRLNTPPRGGMHMYSLVYVILFLISSDGLSLL